ncbi:Hsp20/alpha crystallin family protein [Gracilinema caldarium]|uniref:Heat shock protein Hsp20 n=1 Tax=Gracilinema caldarium (strain ATCC 51460 / DSM 7334 / H1) TaxID=744872 RepID=F8F286_GRAC1|nr:Hsp20/alpha crystallin family protein [Gracilinema caldarium]AEJ20868.1 heat shock protein Hsp20 [Gracilinema caldarium DSM 7334]
MKGNKVYVDLGTIFDEIFEAAQNFSDEFQSNFSKYGNRFGEGAPHPFGDQGPFGFAQDENVDYYPNYSYPPMNVYMLPDRTLVFEFALAGFDEKNISLSFQGDYMVFSAKINPEYQLEENIRYFKRRLKLKDIEKQKYYVPLDKFDQEKVKAVYRNGILKVTIPPKEEPAGTEGIKIEIIKEGE